MCTGRDRKNGGEARKKPKREKTTRGGLPVCTVRDRRNTPHPDCASPLVASLFVSAVYVIHIQTHTHTHMCT
jgi:hypothetical protein